MKPDGHGKARILTDSEMDLLFDKGFTCPRDKALFAISRYTGGRPIEIQKIFYADAFQKETVREKLLLRKNHTKNKQGTRIIKTHKRLVTYLQEYRRNSLELLELKKIYGDWTFLGFRKEFIDVECPRCNSTKTTRDGLARYKLTKQMYECKSCDYHFTSSQVVDGEDIENRYHRLDSYQCLGIKTSASYGLLFLNEKNPYLFPGQQGRGYLCYAVLREIFEAACERVGIIGASPYSFRRTFLTNLHNKGIPLKVIQELSGHRSLGALQRYLDVSDEQVCEAINSLTY